MSINPISKTINVCDLAEGQQVHDLFLIGRKNLSETKNGKPYLALSLMDKTGEIEARVWDNASHFDALAEPGKIVAIEAQVKAFRDKLQLSISSLNPVDDESLLVHFIPVSKRSVKEMKQELVSVIDEIKDEPLRKLLELVFQGEALKQFSRAPAAKQMHHAYLGGLIEHTLSVTGLAKGLAKHYPNLDRDLLVAAALLHDLGKIKEFSFNTVPFDYTDSGRLVGHLVIGSEMVKQSGKNIPGLSSERLDQLIHLILSHHGRHEFGAPCLPMTAEAILLHHIDDIDAKMNYIEKLSEQVEPGNYQWSDYQRPLERFLLLRGNELLPDDPTFSEPIPEKEPTPNKTQDSFQDNEKTVDPQGKLF